MPLLPAGQVQVPAAASLSTAAAAAAGIEALAEPTEEGAAALGKIWSSSFSEKLKEEALEPTEETESPDMI